MMDAASWAIEKVSTLAPRNAKVLELAWVYSITFHKLVNWLDSHPANSYEITVGMLTSAVKKLDVLIEKIISLPEEPRVHVEKKPDPKPLALPNVSSQRESTPKQVVAAAKRVSPAKPVEISAETKKNIILQLENYINRINPTHNVNGPSKADLRKSFRLFPDRQAANREINYNIAVELRTKIQANDPIALQSALSSITSHGIFMRRSVEGKKHTIRSSELNDVLKLAKKQLTVVDVQQNRIAHK